MDKVDRGEAFSCYFIGDDNLTLQCAEIVLKNEHKILGIISKSSKIASWCASNSVPYINGIKEFENKHQQPFDYLFSIVNSEILSSELLKRPSKYAINYHNSPLPKYAGLYATTWAILNNETRHAISWHIMDEVVDAGAILKQPLFSVNEQETALSLNLKCYEQAIHSFRDLVKELVTATTSPKKQNLSSRSYYGLKDKPGNFGFISWEQSAEDIDRLCRALNFGHYTNQLTSPKVIIQGVVFIIKSHKRLDSASGLEPGKIINSIHGVLQIATRTNDMALLELTDLNGIPHTMDSLAQRYNLSIPFQLDSLNQEFIAQLALNPANCPRTERFWLNEFLYCAEASSFLTHLSYQANTFHPIPKRTSIPHALLQQLKKQFALPHATETILLTTFLIYFYRLNNYKNLSIEFSYKDLRSNNAGLDILLSNYLPLTTVFEHNISFLNALAVIHATQTKLTHNHTFAKDIFIRYPELRDASNKIEIRITFGDLAENYNYKDTKKINIHFSEDCTSFYVLYSEQEKCVAISHPFLEQTGTHFLTLLADIVKYPNKKLFELSVIGSVEKNSLLKNWNNTSSDYDYHKPVHRYIEDQVLKTPTAVAAVFEGDSLTYDELNQKSNQLAHYLRKQGVKPDDLIGICLSRSLEMIICILGTLKSGAAYLPIDPDYPKERIAYMLQNSQTNWLLINNNLLERETDRYKIITIDIEKILQKNLSSQNPHNITKPLDLVYVIYTSGTTGHPKGVAIPHQALSNHMLWMGKEYNFQADQVFLQKTPFSFDASVWEFFMPLLVGSKLIIAPSQAHASSKQMIQLINEHKVSVLQIVPSMLKELVATEGFSACTSLKHIFCGGEALLSATMSEFFNSNVFGATLHNLYGPTEATIDSITRTCSEMDTSAEVSLIGKPIMNTKAYVLDEQMQPVPIGITGEMYLSGAGLARGYLNNVQTTEQKFIPNPFASKQYDRLYKTGDLVKWNVNGVLEYHGRCDNQVKIRGYRIELNEIESVSEKISSIHQCVVVPEIGRNSSLSLSAYLVLKSNNQISTAEIRAHLINQIPDYMVPSRFLVVDKFLTSPSGKIDRKNLPTIYQQLGLEEQRLHPHNKLEQSLLDIWCRALKINDIGVEDDFFDLGGNSMSAMSIIALTKDKLSIQLTTRMIFDFPTIHRLAQELENSQLNADYRPNHNLVPIKTNGKKSPIFLVHPIGGSVFWYKALGQLLDKDHPVYGIQDPGLDNHSFQFHHLEEMASYYIDTIQIKQPIGPYIIGGASFGTTVAIEIAKQMQERGEKVTFILSLDGWAYYPSLQENEAYFQAIMQEQNARLLKKYLSNNVSNSKFLLELQWHREKMLTEYILPTITTNFILFKAKELSELFPYSAPMNGWEKFASKGIELHIVPGDHEGMFSKVNIPTLATKINGVLNKYHNTLVESETESALSEP